MQSQAPLSKPKDVEGEDDAELHRELERMDPREWDRAELYDLKGNLFAMTCPGSRWNITSQSTTMDWSAKRE